FIHDKHGHGMKAKDHLATGGFCSGGICIIGHVDSKLAIRAHDTPEAITATFPPMLWNCWVQYLLFLVITTSAVTRSRKMKRVLQRYGNASSCKKACAPGSVIRG